jgi:hypothetical protein
MFTQLQPVRFWLCCLLLLYLPVPPTVAGQGGNGKRGESVLAPSHLRGRMGSNGATEPPLPYE